MKFETITVRGDGAPELLTAMTGPTEGLNKTRYCSDTCSVIAWERYDWWRTSSDLMVVVIMELTDSKTCEVAIMVGGGGDDLLGFDWSVTSTLVSKVSTAERSAEAAALDEAVESLEDTCADLELNTDQEVDGISE